MAGAFEEFCLRVLEVVAPLVPIVKPQSAFFEACGPAGLAALQVVLLRAHEHGLITILDSKRNDIASTAEAYADAVFAGTMCEGLRTPVWPADPMTINPYLGRDAVEPFLAACRRDGGGIFCVLKTSNAGGGEIQDLALSDGRPLWHEVARLVREWGEELVGERGLTSVGAVVGATHPRAIGEARRALPQSILLLPGVGAQSATPADVARAFASGPASALVTVSRSVIYAFRVDGADWRTAAGAEAARLRRDVWAVAGW